MTLLLDKPSLWTFTEAAEIFELTGDDGFRTIRTLVKVHGLEPKKMLHPKAKGLDRADLEVLARALNKTLA